MAENQKPNAEQSGGKTEGCLVKTYDDKPCGRPIHHAPAGVDEMPVCLMHSRDPGKDDVAFQTEFERILKRAGEGVADFIRFVFPSAPYADREVKAKCVFYRAKFTQDADFILTTFTQDAYFREATFTQHALFIGARFTQGANFSLAMFTQDAHFIGARFTQNAAFIGARFTQDADFSFATFRLQARFDPARFLGRVSFHGTLFRGDPKIPSENRRELPTEELAKIKDSCLLPGPIFSSVYFERPEDVYFYKTYLGLAMFHNCDVSEFKFSDVTWLERPEGSKSMVFDEVVDPECPSAEALKPKQGTADSRNYRLIAELYQQLKKNYDDRRDYWTAGDFHYGEMEMKRLATPPAGRILRWLTRHKKDYAAKILWKLKRGWHQRVGVAAWYKRWSEYGENYRRPVAWLALVVLLFGLIVYPSVGLRYTGPSPASAASIPNHAARNQELPPLRWWATCPEPGSYHTCMAGWRLAGNSLMTSLEVAAFQRQLVYEPVYAWGRLLRILELLLTSTFVALFLLALRRQFRR